VALATTMPAAEKALIDATIESIHRHGYADTTVETICSLADLSRGMIRHCFKSKDALLVAAYEHVGAEWHAACQARRERIGAPGRAQLDALARDMFTNLQPAEISAWLAYSVAALSVPELRAVNTRLYDELRRDAAEHFAAAAHEAGIALDAWQTACGFVALSDGLWLQHLLEPDTISREVAIRAGLDFVANALDPKPESLPCP